MVCLRRNGVFMWCLAALSRWRRREVVVCEASGGEAGGSDGPQQLGRKIRNASAIYVETPLVPYAPKWLPGAWQQNQRIYCKRARLEPGPGSWLGIDLRISRRRCLPKGSNRPNGVKTLICAALLLDLDRNALEFLVAALHLRHGSTFWLALHQCRVSVLLIFWLSHLHKKIWWHHKDVLLLLFFSSFLLVTHVQDCFCSFCHKPLSVYNRNLSFLCISFKNPQHFGQRLLTKIFRFSTKWVFFSKLQQVGKRYSLSVKRNLTLYPSK